MKKSKKFRFIAGTAIATALVLTVSVLGAYIGRGSKRGVLVASSYYFESDIMSHITAVAEAADKDLICAKGAGGISTKAVNIRNFSALAFNTFNVGYTVRFWLSEADDGNYDYFFSTDNGNSWVPITDISTTAIPTATAVSTLAGGNISSDTYLVRWEWTGAGTEDISLARHVLVFAEPTSPEYLVSRKLGAELILGEFDAATGYSLQHGFYAPAYDYSDTAVTDYAGALTEYAAFTYRVAVTGTPPAGKTVTLTWDATKLELSSNGEYYPLIGDGGNNLTITLAAATDYDIVFYRKYPGWTPTTTLADCNVTFTESV